MIRVWQADLDTLDLKENEGFYMGKDTEWAIACYFHQYILHNLNTQSYPSKLEGTRDVAIADDCSVYIDKQRNIAIYAKVEKLN